ncbi:unnamed protein product [Closterium sp. NIES-53]
MVACFLLALLLPRPFQPCTNPSLLLPNPSYPLFPIPHREGVRVQHVACFLLALFLPGAHVAFHPADFHSLPPFRLLRILTAGIWHNIVVTSVHPLSPLYSYIRPGDTLLTLDHTPLSSPADYTHLLSHLSHHSHLSHLSHISFPLPPSIPPSPPSRGYCIPLLANHELPPGFLTPAFPANGSIPPIASSAPIPSSFPEPSHHLSCDAFFPGTILFRRAPTGDGEPSLQLPSSEPHKDEASAHFPELQHQEEDSQMVPTMACLRPKEVVEGGRRCGWGWIDDDGKDEGKEQRQCDKGSVCMAPVLPHHHLLLLVQFRPSSYSPSYSLSSTSSSNSSPSSSSPPSPSSPSSLVFVGTIESFAQGLSLSPWHPRTLTLPLTLPTHTEEHRRLLRAPSQPAAASMLQREEQQQQWQRRQQQLEQEQEQQQHWQRRQQQLEQGQEQQQQWQRRQQQLEQEQEQQQQWQQVLQQGEEQQQQKEQDQQESEEGEEQHHNRSSVLPASPPSMLQISAPLWGPVVVTRGTLFVFHVSNALALINAAPIFFLDGEAILSNLLRLLLPFPSHPLASHPLTSHPLASHLHLRHQQQIIRHHRVLTSVLYGGSFLLLVSLTSSMMISHA